MRILGSIRKKNPLPSRTQAWEQVGLRAEVDRRQARRARGVSLVLVGLIAATIVAFSYRSELFPGLGKPVRFATVFILVTLGWALARDLARGIGPALMRRMEPATAGTVGFLVRLFTILAFLVVALRIAGLGADQLALGGAVTAVVVALAAQQTIGNVFAGLIIVTARPYKVGDRLRVLSGLLGGTIEGTVSSVGLIHSTLIAPSGTVMVPNSVLLNVALEPVEDPARVDLRARFAGDPTPEEIQASLEEAIEVELRYPPAVALEELDDESVTVRISAAPEDRKDGPALASQVLRGIRRRPGSSNVEAVSA